MRIRLFLLAELLGIAFFPHCLGTPAFCQANNPSDATLVLKGGTIYVSPTEEPISNGVIVLRDGRIAAVGAAATTDSPEGVETLDCSGLTITAGFWNSHVHFLERKWANAAAIPANELGAQLQEMLTQYGYTSVFDTWSIWENTRRIRDRIESGEVVGPRIRSTGEALIPRGGKPPDLVADILGLMRYQIPEVAEEVEASAASKRLLDAGVDGVKLYAQTYSPPIVSIPESVIRAVVNEAHSRGKPVFAHPSSREGLLASVRAGVDIVVHTAPKSGRWDETVLKEMKESGVALIPTLKLWKYELRHDRLTSQQRFVGAGVEQLRAWAGAGGEVLFGTDVGYMADYNPAEEYALMGEAGMNFRQILGSLTLAPASRFGDSNQQGRIATGFDADLVVLFREPSVDVRNYAAVKYTIRGGRVIYRSDD